MRKGEPFVEHLLRDSLEAERVPVGSYAAHLIA